MTRLTTLKSLYMLDIELLKIATSFLFLWEINIFELVAKRNITLLFNINSTCPKRTKSIKRKLFYYNKKCKSIL